MLFIKDESLMEEQQTEANIYTQTKIIFRVKEEVLVLIVYTSFMFLS